MGRSPSCKVLDSGDLKIIYGEGIMEPKHVTEFKDMVVDCNKAKLRMMWAESGCRRDGMLKPKSEWMKCDQELKDAMLAYDRFDDLVKTYSTVDFFKIKDSKEIALMMGITPFYPAVMINISPDWKGRFSNYKGTPLRDALDVKHFKTVIEKYLGSNDRYTKWKYCIENGSEGNFLHAHIVAQINPRCRKSVETHINKGNHTVELRKHWDKCDHFPRKKTKKGDEGLLKGKYAIQRVMIRKREILEDKLSYLLEDKKPEGHKNLSDLGFVYGGF